MRCNIVGLDGFDIDALANMMAFYKGCGFQVSASRTPLDAELLVIQRGGNAITQPVLPASVRTVHVYDYVRDGSSEFASRMPASIKSIVISPISAVSGATTPGCAPVIGFYPIEPRLWQSAVVPSHRRYAAVHLGHRKKQADRYQVELQTLVRDGKIDAWGNDWEGPAGRVHGAVSLHDCNGIYRQSAHALGVMHANQRSTSLSGRMWQAPMNGCSLSTEALPAGFAPPGVEVVESFQSLRAPEFSAAQRTDMANDSAVYWSAQTKQLADGLGLVYHSPSALALTAIYARIVLMRHLRTALHLQ